MFAASVIADFWRERFSPASAEVWRIDAEAATPNVGRA